MKSEMLVNVSQPEECRIAIVEDGVLEELYIERASADNYVGNIYKGRIVNLEPSIQAAFVDFGVGRNGFLHISDVEPQYFRQGGFEVSESMGPGRMADIDTGDDNGGDEEEEGTGGPRGRQRRPPRGGRPRIKPPIQDIFRRGDEVLVQVIKEGLGTKGPTLSTYISIPGRYLVLMPALGRVGVSRKIEDDQVRRTLRDTLLELNPPKGLGFIVRTAGQDRTKKELSRDMAYLLRLWKVIVRRVKKQPGPCDIYEESDMIIRTIRDIFTQEIDAIYIDQIDAYERAKEFLQLVMPRYVGRLHMYEGKEPLFHKYKLESEIAQIYQRKVPLRSGGSIVIDQTEALVAIDVNSGNFRADDDAEETAYRLNIGRQGDRPAIAAAGSGRRDCERFYRHAAGAASPRFGTRAARRDEARPGPHEDPPDESVRTDRDDAAADSPQPQTERLRRLPLLLGPRCGENSREHVDRSRTALDARQPAAQNRPGDRPRERRGGNVPQQQETPRDYASGGRSQHGRADHGERESFPRTPGNGTPRC
jgi:Rne/Rng family ribonuclease